MQQTDLFSIFTGRIKDSGIPYFIGGSVAAIVYGEPRLTHDIDLILYMEKKQINSLAENFSVDDFYFPPIEVLQEELSRKENGHINIIHHKTGFKADIYFVGNDPLQLWAFENKIEIEFMGSQLPIAPPEYIIVKKLIYYIEGKSEKHLVDIKGILNESKNNIDLETLNDFLLQYDVKEIYDKHFGNDFSSQD